MLLTRESDVGRAIGAIAQRDQQEHQFANGCVTQIAEARELEIKISLQAMY